MKHWHAVESLIKVIQANWHVNILNFLTSFMNVLPQSDVHPAEIVVHAMSFLNSQILMLILIDFPLVVKDINLLELLAIWSANMINILHYILLFERDASFKINDVVLVVKVVQFVV